MKITMVIPPPHPPLAPRPPQLSILHQLAELQPGQATVILLVVIILLLETKEVVGALAAKEALALEEEAVTLRLDHLLLATGSTIPV